MLYAQRVPGEETNAPALTVRRFGESGYVIRNGDKTHSVVYTNIRKATAALIKMDAGLLAFQKIAV